MFDLLRFVGFLPVRALYLIITLTDISDYFLIRPPPTPPTLGGELNTNDYKTINDWRSPTARNLTNRNKSNKEINV